MKHIYTLTLLAGALSLAACTNDDAPQVEAETPAQFLTNLEQRVQTRMADDQWAAADAIGIFTLNDEQEGELLPDGTAAPSNLRMNMKYTRTAGNDAWESADPFYFKNPEAAEVQFLAYYPWTADAQVTDMKLENGQVSGTIAVDASDQSQQPAFDYLYADKESDQPDATAPHGSKNQPEVNFHFHHSMTKVIIKLQPDPEGSTTYDDVQKLTPTLKSFISQGTFNLADGVVTPAAFDAEGAVKDLVLSNKTEEAGTSVSFSAILPPQTTQGDSPQQKDPEVSLSDGTDNYRSAKILSGKTLEAGKCYTVTITVKKMSLVVESTDITDWTPEDGGDADAILQ